VLDCHGCNQERAAKMEKMGMITAKMGSSRHLTTFGGGKIAVCLKGPITHATLLHSKNPDDDDDEHRNSDSL